MATPVRFPQFMPMVENRPGSSLSVALDASELNGMEPGGLKGSEPGGGPLAHGVQRPFSEFLEAQVKNVNQVQKEADTAVAEMVTGRSGNLHETMLALDKADVSFRMLTKVRNKMIDAYHEVMRMNI